MTKSLSRKRAATSLAKRDPASPAIKATGRGAIAIKAGTRFRGVAFKKDTAVPTPDGGYVAGGDYVVCVTRGRAVVQRLDSNRLPVNALGGFHFAPGGNATAGSGGDKTPAINPCSIWDRNFRPVCRDLRGMTLVEGAVGAFWCDIYLLGARHLTHGTSRLGETIADGSSLPEAPPGVAISRFDYAAAAAVLKHHGKTLLGAEEFFAAAFGVTEHTSADGDPVTTKLDAPRTSRSGVMQATGNMWTWGTDGHPSVPRASIFGGSWLNGRHAGSRYANLGYWADSSYGHLGARGRSDHLQLAWPPRQRRRTVKPRR